MRKTTKLVQISASVRCICEAGTIIEIVEKTLVAIIASDKPDRSRVFTL